MCTALSISLPRLVQLYLLGAGLLGKALRRSVIGTMVAVWSTCALDVADAVVVVQMCG